MTFLEALDKLILENACIRYEGFEHIFLMRGKNETILEIGWYDIYPYDFAANEIAGKWRVITPDPKMLELHDIYL